MRWAFVVLGLAALVVQLAMLVVSWRLYETLTRALKVLEGGCLE